MVIALLLSPRYQLFSEATPRKIVGTDRGDNKSSAITRISSPHPQDNRCIRLDGPAARCSGRPKLPRQFVPVPNFEPRLFVPMPGNMGRPAFTFINLYIFCNLQRIINKNIHLGYVCIIRNSFVCLFVGKLPKIEHVGQRFDKIAADVPCVILYI